MTAKHPPVTMRNYGKLHQKTLEQHVLLVQPTWPIFKPSVVLKC